MSTICNGGMQRVAQALLSTKVVLACAILGAMALAWGAKLAVAALFFSGVGCLGVALLLLAIKLYCNGRRGEPKSINRLAEPFSAHQDQLQVELQSKQPPDQYAQV